MSYSFYIGNATPRFRREDGELLASWEVDEIELPDAPAFPNDELSQHNNGRHPSYAGWPNFCREVGLYDLFFDESGHLYGGHPGCRIITQDMVERVTVARRARERTSTLPPGFGQFPDYVNGEWVYKDTEKYDACLARLMWIEWWMKWAMKNCETPAIYNH